MLLLKLANAGQGDRVAFMRLHATPGWLSEARPFVAWLFFTPSNPSAATQVSVLRPVAAASEPRQAPPAELQ